MTDFGLTNLRDSRTPDVPVVRTPETINVQNILFELKREIEFQTKKRDELKTDIAKLQDTKETNTRNMLAELKVMVNKRKKLAKVIKELSKVFFSLKEGKTKFEDEYLVFADREISSIKDYYQPILKKVREKLAKLSVKSKELALKNQFLVELSDYLTEFMQICEATTSLNARRDALLDKRDIDVSQKEKVLEKRQRLVKNLEDQTEWLRRQSDNNYKESQKLVKFFHEEATRERKYLKKWRNRLLGKGMELAAKKKWVEEEKARLAEIKRGLDDRERYIRRLAIQTKVVI